jgi:hypothetical protein
MYENIFYENSNTIEFILQMLDIFLEIQANFTLFKFD